MCYKFKLSSSYWYKYVCVSERRPILLVVDPFFFSHIVWSCGFDTVWFTVNMKFQIASML